MDAAPDIDTLADEDRDRVLETVLGAYRMRVEITADVRYCGTWYDQEPATRYGQFHLLTLGECWVSGAALETPVHLREGDLIVFPAGVRHLLSSAPDAHLPDAVERDDTAMLCGELEFITGSHNPIFAALPRWFGPPFVPSVARGVGRTLTAVRRFAPPFFESGCPGPVASDAVTVGSTGGEDEDAESVVGGAHVGSA